MRAFEFLCILSAVPLLRCHVDNRIFFICPVRLCCLFVWTISLPRQFILFANPVCRPALKQSPQIPFATAATDRATLVAFFRATFGRSWKRSDHWNTDAEISQWYGVELDKEDRVVELSLGFNNLAGIGYLLYPEFDAKGT